MTKRGGTVSLADLAPAYQDRAIRIHAGVMEGEKALKQGRRSALLRKESEDAFNIVVERFLTYALPPLDTWFCHIPNEGKRSKAEGAKLKAKGMKKGAADLLLIHLGRAFMLELKVTGGKVSADQALCHADVRRAGAPVAVAFTLTEVETALRTWGIPLRGTAQGFA
ncbi:putative glutamine amidotransferase [Azospirillum agricola]|uniref:VRR-NUC domain-containing protein n=1 Tax=Azospirillum agricola TaxID=1720247 RepID=UPI001AE9B1D3|nr:VRR-NUC domain-containing protein [Azospirillum agricola]MBP2232506.1 putative glutamine amidotransferase [Azospirillum agricola]